MKPIDEPVSVKDNRIQDNVFYVIANGKKFNIVINGQDMYEFMGWFGWATPGLSDIKRREDANHLADFLNRLYQFAQQTKQKEIQKVLGISSKEDVEEMIKENIKDHKLYDHESDK